MQHQEVKRWHTAELDHRGKDPLRGDVGPMASSAASTGEQVALSTARREGQRLARMLVASFLPPLYSLVLDALFLLLHDPVQSGLF